MSRKLLESQVPVKVHYFLCWRARHLTKGSVNLARERFIQDEGRCLAVFAEENRIYFQAFNLVSSVNVWEKIVLPLSWMEEKWMKRM